MKRIGIIVGGVIVVLVVGLVVVLATIDVNQYKSVVQEQVAAATGRDLTIEGEMELTISLSPAIVLNGVRFQNADWGSRPDMAVIERIEASVPLIPLITGNIEVTRLALVKPDILLERNAQGQANWEFQTNEAPGETEAEATALAISSIEIDKAKLAFKDAQAGSDVSAAFDRFRVNIVGDLMAPDVRQLVIEDLVASIGMTDGAAPTDVAVSSLTLEAEGGGTALSLDATAAGQEVKADGTVGQLARLMAMDGAFPAKLAITLGEFDFDTDLSVDLSGARPSISGTITADSIDLTKLPPAEDTETARVFPADPIPMDGLSAADIDLDVTVNRIVVQKDLAVTNVKSKIVLKDGRLTQTQSMGLAGGTVNSDVTLAAPSGTLSINATGTGILAESIAKDLDATDLITQGVLDFAVDLRGGGQSVAAMMASLDGSIVGGMGEARIRNDAINLAGADFLAQLISQINPFVAQEEFTVAQCAVVNLQVQDGVARTERGIAFVSDRMEITSSGNIDLGQEKLDLNIRPKAKEGLGVGMGKLTQMIKVTGPLNSPGIGLDAGGTVRALGSIAGAFATGGASLLAEGALERSQSAGDTCQVARTWHLAGQ